MLCQNCEEEEATVHLTRIINGEKTELYLCEKCAEKKGQLSLKKNPFSFQNLLAGILNPEVSSSLSQKETLQCDNCGLNYDKFSESGQLGCAECYQEFSSRLNPMIKRIHGSKNHRGKVPKRKGGDLRIENKIEELKEQMEEVIEEENFEKAAELRDKIHELEAELGSE